MQPGKDTPPPTHRPAAPALKTHLNPLEFDFHAKLYTVRYQLSNCVRFFKIKIHELFFGKYN